MAAAHPKPPAKNAKDEYAVFEDALKKVLSVPGSEIRAIKRKRRARTGSASRASAAKG